MKPEYLELIKEVESKLNNFNSMIRSLDQNKDNLNRFSSWEFNFLEYDTKKSIYNLIYNDLIAQRDKIATQFAAL